MNKDLRHLDKPLFNERQIVKVFDLPEKDATSHVCTSPLTWVVGKIRDFGHGLLLWPEKQVSSIPVEFWNHQLMDLSLKDPRDLHDFVSKWGIPYHPFRNLSYLSEEMRDLCGITATEEHARVFVPMPQPKEVGAGYFFTSFGSPRLSFISNEELYHSIEVLKICVNILVYGNDIENTALVADVLRTVNSAACNPQRLSLFALADSVIWDKQGETLEARGLLTSAICNQLISAFADTAQWKECACKGCKRIFKRKQPETISTRPDSDSKYCCTKCKNRQTKRNQREAARNRIRH